MNIAREKRSAVTQMLLLALAFVAYFAVALAVPVLPLQVHQALAAVPALPTKISSGASSVPPRGIQPLRPWTMIVRLQYSRASSATSTCARIPWTAPIACTCRSRR